MTPANAVDCVANFFGIFPLSPRRDLDTRDGFGAPLAPVGQTPLEVTLLGQVGVPF